MMKLRRRKIKMYNKGVAFRMAAIFVNGVRLYLVRYLFILMLLSDIPLKSHLRLTVGHKMSTPIRLKRKGMHLLL